MKNTNRYLAKYIVLLKDLLDEVSAMLLEPLEREPALEWKERADSILSKILGEHHTYTKEFLSIDFCTSFLEEFEEIVIEETVRLALEDARSFLHHSSTSWSPRTPAHPASWTWKACSPR